MKEVEIKDKLALTIEKAAAYSNIGQNKLREMISDPLCPFVLNVGRGKRLIKRKKFDDYIDKRIEI